MPGDDDQLEVHHRGRFLRAVSRGGWEYVERINSSGVIGVIAITDDGELVLIEQPRVPVGRTVVEIPAGLAGDSEDTTGEAMIDAAKRELREETGFEAATWQRLGAGYTSAGMSNEKVTLFVATGLQRVDEGGGDGNEDIAVHLVPVDDATSWVAQRVRDGTGVDLKVYHAIAEAKLRRHGI